MAPVFPAVIPEKFCLPSALLPCAKANPKTRRIFMLVPEGCYVSSACGGSDRQFGMTSVLIFGSGPSSHSLKTCFIFFVRTFVPH